MLYSLSKSLIVGILCSTIFVSPASAALNNLLDPTGQGFPSKNYSWENTKRVISTGRHHVGGGVFVDGAFSFFLLDGDKAEAVSISDLSLQRVEDGGIALEYDDIPYGIDFHLGVECAMAKFIERDGHLLFSLPPVVHDEELSRLGMVPVGHDMAVSQGFAEELSLLASLGIPLYVAKEFKDSDAKNFIPLLKEMDFYKQKVVWNSEPNSGGPNPGAFGGVFDRFAKGIMSELQDQDISFDQEIKSYFNLMESDFLEAYFVPKDGEIRLRSTPLRIHWLQGSSGTKIEKIGILSFESLRDKPLWKPSEGIDAIEELDILTMYNFSSILKTFYLNDRNGFRDIRAMLCQ